MSLLEPVIDLGLGSVIDVVILVVPAKSIPRVNISNFQGTELDKKKYERAFFKGKKLFKVLTVSKLGVSNPKIPQRYKQIFCWKPNYIQPKL